MMKKSILVVFSGVAVLFAGLALGETPSEKKVAPRDRVRQQLQTTDGPLKPAQLREAGCRTVQTEFSIRRQADMDPLSSNNCTAILESVWISSIQRGDRVANELQSLRTIPYIRWVLAVDTSPGIESLRHFELLGFLNDLYLLSNRNLRSLSGLEEITDLPGGATLIYLPRLESLEGLNNLESAGEGVFLIDLFEIPDLSGLDSLQFAGNFEVKGNTSLKSLKGTPNLRVVKDRLVISDNHSLKTLHGLESLREVDKVLIENNPNLESVKHLSSLERVGEVTIRRNKRLKRSKIEQLEGKLGDALSGSIKTGADGT